MVTVFRAAAWRRAALACGIGSSLLYGWMIGFIRYDGYSRLAQVPSELTAIGAPTQPLWAILGACYMSLVAILGWGIWKSAAGRSALRRTGALIIAYGALGLLWPCAAMHQREVLAAGGGTFSDTMHVALGGAAVLLMFATMVVAAPAFGARFRAYTIVSIILLLAFGGLTFRDSPRLGEGLPTPLIGLWERICIATFLTWIVVLAIAIWRNEMNLKRRVPMNEAVAAPARVA